MIVLALIFVHPQKGGGGGGGRGEKQRKRKGRDSVPSVFLSPTPFDACPIGSSVFCPVAPVFVWLVGK